MSDVELISADARRIPLADDTVQCIVTSPPYWGLRKYAGEQELVWGTWRGAYSLEPTVELYVQHSLEILRECRRVLRKDGVVFWNIGDSYHGSWANYGGGNRGAGKQRPIVKGSGAQNPVWEGLEGYRPPASFPQTGLKPKDLVLMPARVGLAAQADGWWVRSDITWAKPNPMPESVTDRPTDSYEHILMLTKSARYFWDAYAVRESSQDKNGFERFSQTNSGRSADGCLLRDDGTGDVKSWKVTHRDYAINGTRNMRNLWEFPTQPYSGAHFATFPEELPRRCILAATSAKGACAKCGAPWHREVRASGGTIGMGDWIDQSHRDDVGKRMKQDTGQAMTDGSYKRETIGWRPSCKCQVKELQPCLVLDPFGGSGTTGRVAIELGRRAVLLDLAYGRATAEDAAKGRDYHKLARRRTSNVQMAFPAL